MIECKKYTLTELKKILHISRRQWEERKEDVLEHLKLYFDYEITPISKGYCIDIYEQYAEYEPLPRKNKTSEISEYYYECTKEEVKEQPWNTGSNIARNIVEKDKNKYEHAEGTICNYVRPIIKKNFLSSSPETQWMRLNDNKTAYIPLTEEEQAYFFSLLEKHNVKVQRATIMGQYKTGYLTKKEASELLFDAQEISYSYIISQFKEKYHFVPTCVSRLEEVQNFKS